MQDKQVTQKFLFGGLVKYQGNKYHVIEINDLNHTYGLQIQHGTERKVNIKAEELTEVKNYEFKG